MNKDVDLYIIAAGKGSRLNASIPKALIEINGEPCLTDTIRKVSKFFRYIYVVYNESISAEWLRYFTTLSTPEFADLETKLWGIPISSGLGDGHAVLQGLLQTEEWNASAPKEMIAYRRSLNAVVMWGDVFLPYPELMPELIAKASWLDNNGPIQCPGVIPVVHETNPYVSVLVDSHLKCMSADFSKYGEKHPEGFHDQSVFLFDVDHLQMALEDLHSAFWKGGRYITPGGELSLLYTFHWFHNNAIPLRVYETDCITYGFNTPKEVEAIKEKFQ